MNRSDLAPAEWRAWEPTLQLLLPTASATDRRIFVQCSRAPPVPIMRP